MDELTLRLMVERFAKAIVAGDRMRFPKGSRFNGYEMTPVVAYQVAVGAFKFDPKLADAVKGVVDAEPDSEGGNGSSGLVLAE